jgi:hypothetical protein
MSRPANLGSGIQSDCHDVYLQNKPTLKEIMRQVVEIMEKVFEIDKFASRFPN